MKIGILQFARLNSTRVPHKLMQTVAGLTLLQRGILKIKRIEFELRVKTVVACPSTDTGLIGQLANFNIETIPEDSNSESWEENIGPLIKPLKERFDMIWNANIFCRPYLRMSTSEKIIEKCKEGTPFICTETHRGSVWNANTSIIYGYGVMANTKTNPVYHTSAHIGYGIPVDMLHEPEYVLANSMRCFPLELDNLERIDIDTQDDLKLARAVSHLAFSGEDSWSSHR
jgi:CMP-2-keto-3-deoxyoctulosonic acid synthetase